MTTITSSLPMTGIDDWWQPTLVLALLVSTCFSVFLFTLPSEYDKFVPRPITEDLFTYEDRKNEERSGLAFFQTKKSADGMLTLDTTVQIVVLGDIGRSPRMQNHALSIANHGGQVVLIGYVESEVLPDILANRFIRVVPIRAFPTSLQGGNRFTFLLTAPLKVLWQTWSLYYALGYTSPSCRWLLVQNPPSIPTLAVAQAICYIRNTRLVVDWHNFGYSILALRLGSQHRLVGLSEWYEGFFSRRATGHFAVSNAMTGVLKKKWNIDAVTLHDRPALHFQPLSKTQKTMFLQQLPETVPHARSLEQGTTKLLVSSTSWTADEDFSLLLQALVLYSENATKEQTSRDLLVVITGKGPQKEYYLSEIERLQKQGKLSKVMIKTAWLSTDDYASLLGSADAGISLHTSSSGVDLPMKVVDMLGTGLPVLGWSKFEAWSELIREGDNGRGFTSAEGLASLLQELFDGDGKQLGVLQKGALKDCERRWDHEWMPVAGKLFQLG